MRLTVLLFAFGICLQAQNRTSGFDGFAGSNPPNPDVNTNPFVVGTGMSFDYQGQNGGFTVVTDPTGFSDIGVTAVSNGTPYLLEAQFPGESFIVTFPNGTFTPVSVDLSKPVTVDGFIPITEGGDTFSIGNATSLSMVGTLASGGTVSTTVQLTTGFQTFTFPSGWQNLSSIRFTLSNSNAPAPPFLLLGALDNFVFSPVCGYQIFQNSLITGLPTSGRSFGPNGGGGQLNIATATGCAWTITGLPAWITTSTAGGTGNGNPGFTVAANTGAERTGTFKVADNTIYVEQGSAIATTNTQARFAHLTTGGGWKFTLVEANLGTAPALGRLFFQNEAGSGFFYPWTFPQSTGQNATIPEFLTSLDRTLNPNAHLVMESVGRSDQPTIVGSGGLSSLSADKMSGFGIFSYPAFHWDAVVPPETRNAPFYILPFDNTGNLVTGVAVNLFNAAGNVAVTILDDTGAQIGTDSITLPSNGHISFMLGDRYAATKGKRGAIRFDRPSSGQIAVLGLRANGPALTSLPTLGNVGTTGGSITHATYNGGFTSIFYVVNTGTTSAPFTLSFYNESDGSALSVPLFLPQTGANQTTSALTQNLAPGAMLVVQTVAQDAAASISGSAVLTTTGNISAFEIFQWTTFGQEASVPLETRTPASFVLIFDNTNGLTTGVALQVVSAAAANINVIIRDDAGTQIGSDTISLPGHGHVSFLLPSKYAIAGNKRGMVEFVVPQGARISAVGLRAKADGTLTTIPVLTK